MNAGAAFTACDLAYAGDALLIAAAELRLMFLTRSEFAVPPIRRWSGIRLNRRRRFIDYGIVRFAHDMTNRKAGKQA
jgi:hypothetical protein